MFMYVLAKKGRGGVVRKRARIWFKSGTVANPNQSSTNRGVGRSRG
jgi:hypothetical protein